MARWAWPLLPATGLAVLLAGCAATGQGLPPQQVLAHGEFTVGVFEPRVDRIRAPREGTLIVRKDGCLALRHSPATGGQTQLVAVPVGSSVSTRGTVYVADSAAGDTDRAGGPVMAAHVGGTVQFTGSEVMLGGRHSEGVTMPPGCSTDGARVLLVAP